MFFTIISINFNISGAHFLEVSVDKLKAFREQGENYGEGKQCDNLLHLILHMYSFKVISFHDVE